MKTLASVLTLLALGLFVAVGTGCAAGGGGGGGGGDQADDGGGQTNDNGDNGGGGADNGDGTGGNGDETDDGDQTNGDGGGDEGEAPALVKTNIAMDDYATLRQIEAGDDLVVYTIGVNETQSFAYIVPSEYDDSVTQGTEIPNGRLYGAQYFVVAGKKVAMSDERGQVWIFDTVTEAMVSVPTNLVTLQEDYLVGDGEFVATFADPTAVTDGYKLKVINTSGAEPVVTSFPDAFELIAGGNNYELVSVDAASRRVAVAGGGAFYVWSIDAPDQPLTAFDLSFVAGGNGINEDAQFELEGDWILYRQSPSENAGTALLSLTDGTITLFNDTVGTYSPYSEMELNGGSFGFFYNVVSTDLNEDGSMIRSVIGSVETAPTMTAAPPLQFYPPPAEDFDTDPESWGQIGYGRTICVTPDGGRWFLGGTLYPTDNTDPLQMSTGGTFEAFADDETISGRVQATDPSSSANVVAFWALRQSNCENRLCDDDIVVGFILLDRL